MDRRLFILALGMFAMGTDNFVVAGLLPGIAESLGTSVGVAGQMVTVYALSYAVMAPVMAAATSAWPRKRLLVLALGLFTAGNVVTALASDLNIVLLSRALAGLGAAMFSPTALGVATALAGPDKRGQALSIVTAGLAGATALGAPLGTFIGGLGSWRLTLWFVALLGLLAMAGVGATLKAVPQPPRISLRERLQPVRDPRILLTLLTSLFAFGGFLMVYTYAGLVLLPVTRGDERMLAVMFLVWGVAATLGNLASGPLVDRFGSRSILNAGLCIGVANFCALPWTSSSLPATLMSLVIWGLVGWGLIVPQQHRLVTLTPTSAPLVLALNNTATYGGLACSGVVGALVLGFLEARFLGMVGAAMIAVALVMAEMAHHCSQRDGMRRRHGLIGEGVSRADA